jgi:hypothetical protein
MRRLLRALFNSAEPDRNACRPVDGPDDTTEHIWTTRDGRGLLHGHDDDGCPLERLGTAKVEDLAAGLASEPCVECGEPHDGGHP